LLLQGIQNVFGLFTSKSCITIHNFLIFLFWTFKNMMIINANIFVHTYTLKGIDKNKTITKDCGENAGQHNNQNRISVSFLLSVSYTCKLCCQT